MLRIVVADDSAIFLEAVRHALSATEDLEVVATATSGPALAAAVARTVPDVVLLDVDMPGGGPALARQLSRRHPGICLVCLSGRDDADTVLAMLAAGVTGYVAKGALDHDLATCVRRGAAGMLFVVASCAPTVRARIAAMTGAPDVPGAPPAPMH